MKIDTYIQDKNKKSNKTKLWKFNGKKCKSSLFRR